MTGLLQNVLRALCLLAALAVTAAAGTLSVDPASLPVAGVTNFTLDIRISGAADLYAFQFDIGFNPSVLSATGITEGDFLGTGGATFFLPGTIDNTAGTLSFTANTLLSALTGVSGTGILAHVGFTSIGNGSSAVSIFNATTLDSSLSGQVNTVVNGSVGVGGVAGAVPEPASVWLFSFGLALAAFGARRRLRGRGAPPRAR